MKCENPVSVDLSAKKQRLIKWNFEFPHEQKNIPVCQQFLCELLGVGIKRLRVLQGKILNKKNLCDTRGKHTNRNIKLNDNVKDLIQIHCYSLRHRESHYKREETALKYFENPELNLSTLYNLFLDYYQSVTQEEDIPLSESSYAKYFNHNLPFSFKLPRTDVCNVCYESETKKVESPNITEHKKKAKDYLRFKKELLSEKDVLCCEFDYAQNLPLPKIPVNDQFYKRLLWLFLFNVHVHNTDKSYMFPYLEGLAKKGANTVCSFLYYTVKQEFNSERHSKIILFSDAASGQNRNYTMFTFLILLSMELNVKILHVFPVRGHSYCICDGNFGMYAQKKKKMERIETFDDYSNLILSARNPPFTIIKSATDILQDFDKLLRGNLQKPKGMKISESNVIQYHPNGQIHVFQNYNKENPSVYEVNPAIKLATLPKLPPPRVGISLAKMKDVKSLMVYLSEKGRAFLNDFFSLIETRPGDNKTQNTTSSDDDSCSE